LTEARFLALDNIGFKYQEKQRKEKGKGKRKEKKRKGKEKKEKGMKDIFTRKCMMNILF